MNGVECRLESGCLTQPLSLAYDKVQMKIKHLGCTAVSIVTVFVILSLSCTRDAASSTETAAETPSDQPSFPGEDSPDAADAAPESFEPEVAAVQEPTEQPESGPVENVAAEGAAEEVKPTIKLPAKLVIDEVTPYLDFYLERRGLEPEWLYGNRAYINAREKFSFRSGRNVDPRYFPVIDIYPIGAAEDVLTIEKAGFEYDSVYLEAPPEQDLIVRTTNTIDGKVYSHLLEAESFHEFQNRSYHAPAIDDSNDQIWWKASFPFMATYFLSNQRFDLELVRADGSVVVTGESTAYSGKLNTPIEDIRVNPFQAETGIQRNQTMYLRYLPPGGNYIVFYKSISYQLFPVAATFLESEPSVEDPIAFYFSPKFPAGEYAFEVISPHDSITSKYMDSVMGEFRESGYLMEIIYTTKFYGR